MKKAAAAIEIRDLFFSYEQSPILTNVQLQVMPFDSICVVGPNGGGKTTLLKLIIGLLEPGRGTVKIFGRKPADAYNSFGYVPQHAYYDRQFPISIKEVVRMGRLGNSFTGRYSKTDMEKTMAALDEVGLADKADSSFSALSGGQRQRVLIARALASGGEILLLDEPTANIDKESEGNFFDLLKDLSKRMTILMVTHDIAFASSFFTRIACVNREVVIHPTSELTGELIREMYGGDLRMIRHDHQCTTEGHVHG